MNKIIFLIVHVLILAKCQLVIANQGIEEEKTAIQVQELLAKKVKACKKYADFLAATPDLNNQMLLDKVGTDLMQVVMSFLVIENFSQASNNDYVAWQQDREKKFLRAAVSWHHDDIEYIKENLRLDLWLHKFSHQYNAASSSTEKETPFYQHLDNVVRSTLNIGSFTPSRLYEMQVTKKHFDLFCYMQQAANSPTYHNEIEVAALMLVCNQPVQHYLNPYQPALVKDNRLIQAVEYFQSHPQSLYHQNSKDTHGRTLGHQAVVAFFIPVIHMLLQDGIDFTMMIQDKKTALDVVQSKALQPERNSCVKNCQKYYHVWQILDQAGIKNNTAFRPCPNKDTLENQQYQINRQYFYDNGRYEHEYS